MLGTRGRDQHIFSFFFFFLNSSFLILLSLASPFQIGTSNEVRDARHGRYPSFGL